MRREPADMELLSRTAFEHWVLKRTNGQCVFCGAPAADAHHWDCETTSLSVAQARGAAGIERGALPPGFLQEATDDKWGNRCWPSGLRSWGPLEHDTGARKALAQGAMMPWMMPSTYRELDEGEPS